MLLESAYNFMVPLRIHMDADSSIISCQGFSEKKILYLLSDHLRQIFDDLYWARILGRDNLGSSIVDNTATILWVMLQSNEVMAEFYKN